MALPQKAQNLYPFLDGEELTLHVDYRYFKNEEGKWIVEFRDELKPRAEEVKWERRKPRAPVNMHKAMLMRAGKGTRR